MLIPEAIAWGVRKYAYGEATVLSGDGDWLHGDETSATSSAYANTILFHDRCRDSEIDVCCYRARMCDPATGRRIPTGRHGEATASRDFPSFGLEH